MNREIDYTDMRASPLLAIVWTANAYTSIASDLLSMLSGTTSSTNRTLTLLDAATAGPGAVQMVFKADAGVGALIVSNGSATLATLRIKGQIVAFVSDGAVWLTDWREPHPTIYESGVWYDPFFIGNLTGAAPSGKDILFAVPLRIETDMTLDALGVLNQAGATLVDVRFALYASNPTNPRKPDGGALLTSPTLALVSLPGTAVGASVSGLALPLKRGIYWGVTKYGNSGTLANLSVVNQPIAAIIGGASLQEALGSSTLAAKGYSAADAFANNFPSTFPTSTTVQTAVVPLVAFKAL